jgi:electron transfer flavoprotein alpha subunit
LKVLAVVKQVPALESMALDERGRLIRSGPGELNPYCRRAVAKAVELARATAGHCTVLTLGPPDAEEVLRESLAWGADAAIHLVDPAFSGSDTLATAGALAAAIRREGSFDLILAGRNSVDGETGQLAAELAELLDLPFLAAARTLELEDSAIQALCEVEDGWQLVRTRLPAIVSCAERLCAPAKVPPEKRTAVPAELIRRIGAVELGTGPWGEAASPTRVGPTRAMLHSRRRQILVGGLDDQVRELAAALTMPYGDVTESGLTAVGDPVTLPVTAIAVIHESGQAALTQELLSGASRLAPQVRARVVVLDAESHDVTELARWGADAVVRVPGEAAEEFASALTYWARESHPWAVLAPSTNWGRETAGRTAAALGAGLIGDAIELDYDHGRLVAWKPAFGGAVVAAITSSSEVQLVTVRPGVLSVRAPRTAPDTTPTIDHLPVSRSSRVEIVERCREDQAGLLQSARVVIGVGSGVTADELKQLEPLRRILNAEFAATRRVTDQGWMPRTRQIGLTGHSIAPDIYIAVGISGKFNHTMGVRGASLVVAINRDRAAPIFDAADLGIVADWHDVVPALGRELASATGTGQTISRSLLS